jgi:hypothetical protein
MKKWFFIIFILLVIILSGIFVWKMILSPVYSLKQLEKAINKRDIIAFNKYVDLDATVDEVIVQTLQYYTAGEATGSRWNEIRSDIGNTLLSVVKPNIKEIIKEEVLGYIATGQWPGNDPDNKNDISTLVINLIKDKIDPEQWDQQSINYTEINGNIAHVGLTYFDDAKDTNFIVEVKMRNMKGYWQIIGISNVAEILNMYQNKRVEKIKNYNVY